MSHSYRIKSIVERDDITNQPLYWSNEDGWVDKGSATVFSKEEYLTTPYLPLGSEWEAV
jgi:hypothetical protein